MQIQDIRAKYPDADRWMLTRRDRPHASHAQLEQDMVINAVAQALQRLTRLEQSIQDWQKEWHAAHHLRMIWLILLTSLVFFMLISFGYNDYRLFNYLHLP